AAYFDHIAHDMDDQWLFLVLALDGQHDGCFRLAAHQLDGVVQGHALGRLAVDVRNDVARKNAGTRGRRVLDGGDDLGHAVFAADLDTQAAEAALGDGFHFLERLGVQVGGMRIQVAEHTFDGIADKLMIGNGLYIAAFDRGKYIGELLQLFKRKRVATLGSRRYAQADQHPAQRACDHQTETAKPASAHARSRSNFK